MVLKVEANFLSYEGTFGVGYAICAYKIIGEDDEEHFDIIFEKEQIRTAKEKQKNEDLYVKLARLSLETYVRTGKFPEIPDNLPEEMIKNRQGYLYP